MNAINHANAPIGMAAPAAQPSVAKRVARVLAHLLAVVKNRRDAALVSRLDDRMLADIGLTRSDVRDAFSQPIWADPTAVLVNRARERRFWALGRGDRGARRVVAPPIVPEMGERTLAPGLTAPMPRA